jgi:hypothetical protein
MATSGFVRFKHNPAGYRAVLRSEAVRVDLDTRAQRVKAAADAELSDPRIRIVADTTVGRNRAGATIIGVPLRIERSRRVLGRAIDAAR